MDGSAWTWIQKALHANEDSLILYSNLLLAHCPWVNIHMHQTCIFKISSELMLNFPNLSLSTHRKLQIFLGN
jgi:hypothetical protein